MRRLGVEVTQPITIRFQAKDEYDVYSNEFGKIKLYWVCPTRSKFENRISIIGNGGMNFDL